MKETKEQKIIWQIYREMYAISTPPANFDKLVEEAEINEEGLKIIPFNDYEISEKDFDRILEEQLKGKRMTKLKKQMFKNTITLGVSPRFKKDEHGNKN